MRGAQLLTQIISTVVVVGVGLATGWRVHFGPADVAEAFTLALLFGYAFTRVDLPGHGPAQPGGGSRPGSSSSCR